MAWFVCNKKRRTYDLLVDFWLNSYSVSNFELKLKLNYASNKNVLSRGTT